MLRVSKSFSRRVGMFNRQFSVLHDENHLLYKFLSDMKRELTDAQKETKKELTDAQKETKKELADAQVASELRLTDAQKASEERMSKAEERMKATIDDKLKTQSARLTISFTAILVTTIALFGTFGFEFVAPWHVGVNSYTRK